MHKKVSIVMSSNKFGDILYFPYEIRRERERESIEWQGGKLVSERER